MRVIPHIIRHETSIGCGHRFFNDNSNNARSARNPCHVQQQCRGTIRNCSCVAPTRKVSAHKFLRQSKLLAIPFFFLAISGGDLGSIKMPPRGDLFERFGCRRSLRYNGVTTARLGVWGVHVIHSFPSPKYDTSPHTDPRIDPILDDGF